MLVLLWVGSVLLVLPCVGSVSLLQPAKARAAARADKNDNLVIDSPVMAYRSLAARQRRVVNLVAAEWLSAGPRTLLIIAAQAPRNKSRRRHVAFPVQCL
ncbi:hypothetical protein MES4922_120178 [Mesorhizobium ventifaucium]|uniref:Uncharacterized protein n=1 Tax=Mesorhizobium ventifaucium TaxID=666020 RepID=A0ABM9DHU2_9HYPH|nr:hypothetical protein MES4922_120178 [Mesorhizobium ventifaucium]